MYSLETEIRQYKVFENKIKDVLNTISMYENCDYSSIESCISNSIRSFYRQNNGHLFHLSQKFDCDVLRASENYDMYHLVKKKSVFATSNPYEIWLYACRAITGKMYEKNRICIYNCNPFRKITSNGMVLKHKVAFYEVKVDNFYPVVNIKRNRENKWTFQFDNEWRSDTDAYPIRYCEFDTIPIEFLKYYDVYYFINDNGCTYNPQNFTQLNQMIDKHIIRKVML